MPYRIPQDKEVIDCTNQSDQELLEGVLYCGKQAMAKDTDIFQAGHWFKLQGVVKRELLSRCLKVKKGELVKLTPKKAFQELVDDLPITIDFMQFTDLELETYKENLGARCQRVTWSHRPISAADPVREVMAKVRAEQERRAA